MTGKLKNEIKFGKLRKTSRILANYGKLFLKLMKTAKQLKQIRENEAFCI